MFSISQSLCINYPRLVDMLLKSINHSIIQIKSSIFLNKNKINIFVSKSELLTLQNQKKVKKKRKKRKRKRGCQIFGHKANQSY